jgi:hypothetical protein
MGSTIAILTGDLIGSTRAAPERVEVTMALLAETAATVGDDTRFTRSRGDGWQMALSDPGDCLRACLHILARLRANRDALPTRIAVGIGTEYPTDATDLSTAMGPAFTASGRALELLDGMQILTIAGEGIEDFRRLAFAFAEDYARRWSVEQAEAMAMALDLDAPTQEQIAARLSITRQAVGSRLRAAGYRILAQASRAFLADHVREGR